MGAGNEAGQAGRYHHGDLRETLVLAARSLIEEKGLDRFTLRECARRAGVSHNAPSHHFGDVKGLLTEVAASGFDRLTEALAAARDGGGAPRGRMARDPSVLERIGRAYVETALAHPSIFRLMFHSDRVDRTSQRYTDAGNAAFAQLVMGIGAAQGRPATDDGDLRFAWATLHGIAMLLMDGPLIPAGGSKTGGAVSLADDVVRRMVAVLSARTP